MIDPSAPLGYGGLPPQPPQARPRVGAPPPQGQQAPLGPPPAGGHAASGYARSAPGYPKAAHRYGQVATPYPGSPASGQPTATGGLAVGRPRSRPVPRRAPRSDPGGLVAGLVISGLGLFFLAGQLEPDIGRFVTLFIGLALLAVFVLRREYGFLVPGSLLTGIGIGIALEPAMSGTTENGVMMLALAGGFLGIWVLGSLYRLPQNHWWPLIPGGILTLIGLVQLSRTDVDGALRLWPVILVIIGSLVLGRTISRRT